MCPLEAFVVGRFQFLTVPFHGCAVCDDVGVIHEAKAVVCVSGRMVSNSDAKKRNRMGEREDP